MAPVCPDLLVEVFTFHRGALLGRELFTEPILVIGRDPNADIVLESTTVSRQHARLLVEVDGATLSVRDDGSSHGTRVNGAPVDERRLGRFDEIQIGDYVLKARILGPRQRVVSPATVVDATDWDDTDQADLPEVEALPPPEDDDDDDGEDFEPAFSLASQLLHETRHRSGGAAVEVLTLVDDCVEGADLIRRGSFWIGPDVGWLRRSHYPDLQRRHRLLRFAGERCRVSLAPDSRTTLLCRGRRVSLEGQETVVLRRDEILDVRYGARRYHVRFVKPPARLRDRRPLWQRIRPTRTGVRAFGGSLVAHLGILLLLGVLLPAEVTLADARTTGDRFVTVAAQPAEPEPETTPQAVPPKARRPEPPRAIRRGRADEGRRKGRAGSPAGGPRGLLDTLNRHGREHAPGSSIERVASNLTFSRTPGGFKVAGLQSAMPTSEINLGGLGGGPGRAVTRELLRHGGGLGRKAARAVGGRVGKIDFNGGNGRLKKKGCQLDRDEVQRVVNRHIGAVQQCYERELLKQSGLSGKIRIEWTIRANGTAKNVRQVFSSMSSTAVSRCIMEEIRTWRFLPSSCGEVTVGYPFLFESLRF